MIHVGLDLHHKNSYDKALTRHKVMFPGAGRQEILIFTFTISSSFGKRKAGFVDMKP